MWGRDEEHHCSYHCEQCEDDQTQSVQNHGSKLPVTLCAASVIITPDLVSDHSQLLQDQRQLSHRGGGKRIELLLIEWQFTR